MQRETNESDIRGVDVAGPRTAHPIVFVHGVMFTRKMWGPQRDALADDYRVVVPDLPGHGARADEEFDMGRALAFVDEVVETVADGRATVVGLSLGGYVATAFANRHPEKVDGLVVSGSSANPVGALEPLTRGVAAAWNVVAGRRSGNWALRKVTERWVRGLDLPPTVEAEMLAAGFYPEQFGVAGFELAGTDFRAAFASYPGPALVLNGQWDLVNRLGERRHGAAGADAHVETIAGAGHVCNLERPGAFDGAIRRFVDADS